MKNFKFLIASLGIISILSGCLNSAGQSSVASKASALQENQPTLSALEVNSDYGRNAWVYVDVNGRNGSLEKIGNRWRERTVTGTIKYLNETNRTSEYVVLYDNLSNFYLRLNADKGQVSSDDGKTWNNWNNGGWAPVREAWYYQKDAIFSTFENNNGLNWLETLSNGTRYYFVETARTAEYVELYDTQRKLTLRLSNDQAQFSVAGSTWSVLAQGSWGAIRQVWEYTSSTGYGYFAKVSGDTWKEKTSNNQIYTFKEISRNSEYIEILDQSRAVSIRLYADKNTLRISRSSNYSTLATGNWGRARNSFDYTLDGKSGVFEKETGNKWIETNPKGIRLEFTEVARNKDAVILFDTSRNIYLSLQSTRVQISNNSGASWDNLANGNFSQLKNAWLNIGEQNARFKRKDGNAWVEDNKGMKFNFVEVARNSDALYLYDVSRNMMIKLTDDLAYWSLNAIDNNSPTWNILDRGGWMPSAHDNF